MGAAAPFNFGQWLDLQKKRYTQVKQRQVDLLKRSTYIMSIYLKGSSIYDIRWHGGRGVHPNLILHLRGH